MLLGEKRAKETEFEEVHKENRGRKETQAEAEAKVKRYSIHTKIHRGDVDDDDDGIIRIFFG